MNDEININEMLAEMNAAADRAEVALNGQFSSIYSELRKLSPAEIDDITPDTTDQIEYERLMALVVQATKQNLDNAQLVERVKKLGVVAVSIAKKVPTLAQFL